MKHNISLIAALLLASLAAGAAQAQDRVVGEAFKLPAKSTLNMQHCPAGKWEMGTDKWGPIVRVNMLKIEDADWEKVPGVKKAWRMKGFEGVAGMAFHPIISEVKDVDGDGNPDIFRLRSEHAGARLERLRYDDGSVVWESDPVGDLYGDESRLAVYELNGPGDWCVFHADKAGVYCFDAATGKTRWRVDGGGGDFTVGHFLQRKKMAIVIHANGTIFCLDENGKRIWSHDTGLRGNAAYAHQLFSGDADNDGLDEILVNMQKKTLALRGDGKLLWEDNTQEYHSDFTHMADVDEDGRMEFIYDHSGDSSEKGPVYIVDALTGQRKVEIDYHAQGLRHAQQAVIGKFDPSRKGLQLALCGKSGKITLWDATSGELLWTRDAPATALSRGDWNGDGNVEIMAFAMGVNVDGIFTVWNGKGERLYAISFLPSPYNYFQTNPQRQAENPHYKMHDGGTWRAHAMSGGHEGIHRQVDLDDNGRADVIMPFGEWHWGSDSILFLMEGTKDGLQKSGKAATNVQGANPTECRRLPVAEYRDKMKGAWLGQMIGVGWGDTTEGKFNFKIIPEDKMPLWTPEMVNQYNNDDCYVEMTFMKTLETYGFDTSIRQAGIDFANSGYKLWHANKAGRDNLRKGIAPPDSGHPQFNKCADDIDYQIQADYSGIIAPGLPNTAIALGEKFGRLMNYGDGVYAGQFIGGMYAEAYFQSDPWKIVEAGLKCLPPDSQYAEMVRDLMEWCRANPDWTRTWQLADDKYHKDRRYYGHLCGLDVKLNGAYVIMGLLYGRNDLDKTIVTSCRCGFDSDCNPANAAGVLGAILGASKIPARFTEKLDPTRKFSFSDYTLSQVYDLSEKLARQAVVRAGGKIEKDANGEEVFVIPVQKPNPSALERSWQPGHIANSRFTAEERAKIGTSKKGEPQR